MTARPALGVHWPRLAMLLVLLVSAGLPGNARANGDPIPFGRLSVSEGLSQAIVNAIAQDDAGFLWVGTQEGLNRYDGSRFIALLKDPQDPESLSHNWIYALILDREGFLWVGTYGGGLDRLDPKTLKLRHYRHDAAAPLSLGSDRIRALYEDAAGRLWIGTDDQGLDLLEPNAETFVHFPYMDLGPDSLGHASVRSIQGDRNGFVWIGTDGGGLARLDPATRQFTHYRHSAADPHSLGSNRVSKVYVDRTGQLWVGTYDSGLARFDAAAATFVPVPLDSADAGEASADSMVRDIFEDSTGGFWVATDAGLYHRGPGEDGFAQHRHDPQDPLGLSEDRVTAIFQDQGGVLWVGTYAGLNHWNLLAGRFLRETSAPDHPQGLGGSVVTSFAEDARTLWVGLYGAGLDALDRASGTFRHFRADPRDPGALGDDRVMSLYMDQDAVLWVGTMAGGLNRWDAAEGRFTRYRYDPMDPRSLSADGVTFISDDGLGGLLVGTFRAGLNRLDRATGRFTHFRADPTNPQTLSSDQLVAIEPEKDHGLIWIGAHGGGLNGFNPRSGTFQQVRHDPADALSLSDDSVLSLHLDDGGDLWIGTEGGLNRWRGADRRLGRARFEHLTRKQGLPSDVIQGIESDASGGIWISTNRGLSRIDRVTGKVKNYDVGDGLQSEDFNQGAHFRGADGRLFFGGARGFNAFDPREMRENTHAPPVALTAFLINDRPVELDRPLADLRNIEVRHADRTLAFEIAVLDFADPQRNRFMYKMEGFDADWLQGRNRSLVTYTNLPAGRYTLRVKAANNDGVWNEEGLSIGVRVFPAPWLTWWAFALYAALIAGLLRVYVALHTRRIRRLMELQRAEEATAAKSRLLATLSHEIRTPMNGVLGTIQLLLETRLDSGQQRLTDAIQRSAETLLAVVNDVLDYAKIDAGKVCLEYQDLDLREEIEDVLDLLAPLAHTKGLDLALSVQPGLTTAAQGDPLRIRQVITNLVGNAIKFTDLGQVIVHVRRASMATAPGYRIEVADTGLGVTEAQRQAIFESFTQADSSTTRRFGGTGLGLTIAKRLVEAMGGEIGVESQPGQGSVFHLTLPLPACSAAAEPMAQPASGRRILIVDKNAEVAAILQAECAAFGMEAHVDPGRASLVDRLSDAVKARRPYDLVLLDQEMPGIGSAMLVRLIRASPDMSSLRILMMMRQGGNRRKTVTQLNEVDAVLAKPVRRAVLLNAIHVALGLRVSDIPALDGSADMPPARILLADDNRTNQEVASMMLNRLGYPVDLAVNGLEALDAMQGTAYDLVLMDCLMPGMDGLEATRRLRELERGSGRHTRIIALTADGIEANRESCLAAGMDDFLVKPLGIGTLRRTLSHWLGQGRDVEPERLPEPAPGRPQRFGRTSDGVLDHEVLESIHALQQPGQPDLVKEVVNIYLEETPRLLQSLREAVQHLDHEGMRRAAHSLKSSSAHVGARALAALAWDLELRARNRSADGAARQVALMERNYLDAKQALEQIARNIAA
ncbi:hybrid sensor histidine kinase/response regulator [Thiocystis violacea]|uniref:hybrid sensor histidine kinase/response regulator n=1 Tax=Thiocystis violacea TaxID=13725 RepID=UPI00190709EB|nr:hybrid sensor histidine kinase/response regulator [Thiocystis violacea]MBK1720744.1 hypothetical protein [Thiocystis violacea]